MTPAYETELEQLAARVGALLSKRGILLATAESCTGGWVAQTITAVPGSSAWFERGFVSYSNNAKQEMLGVRAATLETCGAVSEATAREMAEGALLYSHAQVSLAITGIAGPTGGTPDKPVGSVCLAWAGLGLEALSQSWCFPGERADIRRLAVIAALQGLEDFLTHGAPEQS